MKLLLSMKIFNKLMDSVSTMIELKNMPELIIKIKIKNWKLKDYLSFNKAWEINESVLIQINYYRELYN